MGTIYTVADLIRKGGRREDKTMLCDHITKKGNYMSLKVEVRHLSSVGVLTCV